MLGTYFFEVTEAKDYDLKFQRIGITTFRLKELLRIGGIGVSRDFWNKEYKQISLQLETLFRKLQCLTVFGLVWE